MMIRRMNAKNLGWKLAAFVIPLTIALGVGFSNSAAAESPDDLLIIANKSVGANQVSAGEIKAIFMKQRGSFSSGDRATPVNAKKGSALRKAFQLKVLGMDDAEEQKYWQDQKIKTGTSAPIELTDTVRAVFSMGGGLSYCFRKDFKPGTAKVLLTI